MRMLFLKRPFDVLLSLAGIGLSSPLWGLISALIWLEDRGPIFYAQDRVGEGGQPIRVIKFRSMIVGAEAETGPVQAKEDDPRITRIGRILRATAMDELPQLLNILKGDMSFVGPRALRPEEVEDRYWNYDSYMVDEDSVPRIGSLDEESQPVPMDGIRGCFERLSVPPGLTGLAQIYLPANAPRRKKFRYDLLYIKKRTFGLDIRLILLSFWITFRGKWVSREDKV
jgi:lipopolysaccharide/colanic/teichoic acid biosynthesis glycosyltransferase